MIINNMRGSQAWDDFMSLGNRKQSRQSSDIGLLGQTTMVYTKKAQVPWKDVTQLRMRRCCTIVNCHVILVYAPSNRGGGFSQDD